MRLLSPFLGLPLLLAGFLFGLSIPTAAQAQTCSATISDVDFGDAELLSTSPTDVLGTVTVTCTRISLFTQIKMCPGIGDGSGGDDGSSRRLNTSGGGNVLTYQLYQDSSRTLGWGATNETQLGTIPLMIVGTGFSSSGTVTRTLYARLFASQSASPPGAYTSVFAGSETSFTYSVVTVGTSGSCTGFTGSSTLRPSFDVVATPAAGCAITTADLDFGSVGVISSAISAQSTMRVACTKATPFTVMLDGGIAGAAPAARRMTNTAGEAITYGLYRDAARTLLWGSTSSTRASGTGSGTDQVFTIYGLVPAQSVPRPGLYSDRIVATVTY